MNVLTEILVRFNLSVSQLVCKFLSLQLCVAHYFNGVNKATEAFDKCRALAPVYKLRVNSDFFFKF